MRRGSKSGFLRLEGRRGVRPFQADGVLWSKVMRGEKNSREGPGDWTRVHERRRGPECRGSVVGAYWAVPPQQRPVEFVFSERGSRKKYFKSRGM